MKIDITPDELIEQIADYDPDIWNNPKKWGKTEWHMWDLFLYYNGFDWFQRHKLKKRLRKAIK